MPQNPAFDRPTPCGDRPGLDAVAPKPGRPARRDSEAAAVEAWRAQGFTASFVARAGALQLADGNRAFRPGELVIRGHQRFEGASDPDDMAIVYAIEAADGTKGTLVDAFGVYANPAVTAVLDQIRACGRSG
jgi:hypothetical protein